MTRYTMYDDSEIEGPGFCEMGAHADGEYVKYADVQAMLREAMRLIDDLTVALTPDDDLKAACEKLWRELLLAPQAEDERIQKLMAFVRQREAAIWRVVYPGWCKYIHTHNLSDDSFSKWCEAQARAREGTT